MNIQFGGIALDRPSQFDAVAASVPRSNEALRVRCYAALAIIDLLALMLGCVLGAGAHYGLPLALSGPGIAVIIAPIFFVLAFNGEAYSAEVLEKWRCGAGRALVALAASALAFLFFSYFLKASADVSRVLFGTSIAVSAVLLVAGRAVFDRHARRVFADGPISRLLICDGVPCPAPRGVRVIDAARAGLSPDISDPMMLDRLGRLLRRVDGVSIACSSERRVAWAMVLKGANIHGELIMPEISAIGGIGAGRLGEDATMIVSAGPLDLRGRAMKRTLDILLGFAAFIVLAPLLGLVALAVRMETPGPVFFVQKRLGQGNRLFSIYKFRSMRADQCDAAGHRSASRDDDRITKVGKFIRATSIDELPQIFNILKGDMSFVGPRPHPLGCRADDQLFWDLDRRYLHRHASKPGLTGLAQVRGLRGATLQRSDLINRLQADLEYQNGWTLWRDISILIATLRVVVHKNAF